VQRAILEVRSGRLIGTKTVVLANQRLTVGRKPLADLVIPDNLMSGIHFEITLDDERCRIADLESHGGTMLGGERVTAGEARNGAWIRAGGTDFTVHFEAATPPPLDFESYFDDAEDDEVEPLAARWLRANREPRRLAAAALAARKEQAIHALRGEGGGQGGARFAVLDTARSERILVLLKESVEACRSLYEGLEGDALAHVAPYLVELPPGSGLLERLVREGWEKRWGIFIDFDGSFKELRRHLRRLLIVGDAESRQSYYFRFYDPVVLRAFLPSCSVKQRTEMFGEIRSFFTEGDAGEVVRHAGEVAR
jgi:pSer/pThr/pTyr-binding forkhead associated (FHA) protein